MMLQSKKRTLKITTQRNHHHVGGRDFRFSGWGIYHLIRLTFHLLFSTHTHTHKQAHQYSTHTITISGCYISHQNIDEATKKKMRKEGNGSGAHEEETSRRMDKPSEMAICL